MRNRDVEMKTDSVPNAKQFSRRRFGRLLAASPLAVAAAASPPAFSQSPPALRQALSKEDQARSANAARLASAAEMAKFKLPIETEPSFAFRP